MKKLVVACVSTICFISQTFAQHENVTSRGNFAFGAQGNYTNQNTFETKGFTLSGQYFFTNDFSLGLIIPVSHTETGRYVQGSYVLDRYSIGPTIRYNYPLHWKFHLLAHVDFTYGNQKTARTSDIPGASGTYNSSSTMLRIGVGLNYFISKPLAIEALVYYERVNDNIWGYSTVTPNYALGLKYYVFQNF